MLQPSHDPAKQLGYRKGIDSCSCWEKKISVFEVVGWPCPLMPAGFPSARGRCPLPSSCPSDERGCFCRTDSPTTSGGMKKIHINHLKAHVTSTSRDASDEDCKSLVVETVSVACCCYFSRCIKGSCVDSCRPSFWNRGMQVYMSSKTNISGADVAD